MIKIDVISGFLGAGKTTLIKKLFESKFNNEKVVLIENEFGEIGIDGSFLKESGIEIKEINSGCICCSLVGDFATSMKEVIKKFNPERIIVEPSGVGKLSDIVNAIKDVDEDLKLNILTTVVDGPKCKMYIKNFGEFFINQVDAADTIIINKIDKLDESKLEEVVNIIKEKNPHALIISTPLQELDPVRLLSVLESKVSLKDELIKQLEEEHHHHEECCHHDHHHGDCHHDHHGDCCHEHHDHEECHHEHHDHEECCCHEHHVHEECCHHDHHGDCCHEHHEHEECHHEHGECCHDHHHGDCHHEHHGDCCHDHHHEHEECCHHDHHHGDCHHEHHHGDCCHEHHDHEECCHHEHHHGDCHHDHHHGECCHEHHHHHHDADEVFTSWGMETHKSISKAGLESFLDNLSKDESLGIIVRSKGILKANDNSSWYYFDYVSGDYEIRLGAPDAIGRLCVIGSKIDEHKIEELFKSRG